MRALWLTEEVPGRELGGGSIRQAHLFQALAAELPTDLWVVGEVRDEGVRAAAARISELDKRRPLWSDRRLLRRPLQLGLMLCSPWPSQLYFSGPGRRALARRLRAERHGYDLVIVAHEALAPLIPRRRRGFWAIDLHHLVSEMAQHEAALAGRLRQRWLLASDVRKAQALERRILHAFDRVLVCSEEDAAALRRLDRRAEENVAVVPNGVDLARFEATPVPREPRILFPGTLGFLPNVAGARWLCTEILPQVRASVPDAEVELVGRAPVREVMELAKLPGVTVHADVPSMLPYFEAARVVVVPLRIGSGTRLKALEAMASGRPVVGTKLGLAGVGIVDREHAIVADDSDAIAAAIAELLADDGLSARLGAAGRAHVERHHGWNAIGPRFVSELLDALDRRCYDGARDAP